MPRDDDLDEDDFDDLRIDRPRDDYATAQIAHWGGLLTSFLVPLILFLTQTDPRSFAAWHARESLNFQISLLVYYAVACVPMCLAAIDWWFILVGFAIMLLLTVLEFVLTVMASIAVARGERYRYPLTISFVPRPSADRNHYDHRE